MSKSEKDKDIARALNEMEQASSELNARKSRIEARIKKYAKPIPEISTSEKIEQKAKLQLQDKAWTFKTQLALWLICGAIGELIIYYFLARKELVNFVFYNIAVICLYGMIASRLK